MRNFFSRPTKMSKIDKYGDYTDFSLGSGFVLMNTKQYLLGMGDNKFGQCGPHKIHSGYVAEPTPVSFPDLTPALTKTSTGFQFSMSLTSRFWIKSRKWYHIWLGETKLESVFGDGDSSYQRHQRVL